MADVISTKVSPITSKEAAADMEEYYRSKRAKVLRERLERETYGRDKKIARIAREDLVRILQECKGNISESAKMFGVPSALLRKLIYSDQEILTVMQEARERAVDEAERMLQLLVENGNAHATIFTLKTLGADRGYGIKRTVEHEIGVRAESTAAKLIEAMRKGTEPKALPEPKEEVHVWDLEVEAKVVK